MSRWFNSSATTNSKRYVNFSGNKIETTVTDKSEIVVNWIREIRQIHTKRFLVGLDCEWKSNKCHKNEVATLQLCIENKCLIIQLLHIDRIPRLLRGFLHDSAITFAGVEVERDTRKLTEDYGLKCFTVVDVQKLLAMKSDEWTFDFGVHQPRLKARAFEAVGLPKKVTIMSNWEARVLREDQVQYACIDAYVSYKLGHALLMSQRGSVSNRVKTFDKINKLVISWLPPDEGVIKANCDGASRGNPGNGGA
ncbi:Polynucleotidyl transferase, ribonuclease H-like superfamily protein, partial [Thalictrum thalictroides]